MPDEMDKRDEGGSTVDMTSVMDSDGQLLEGWHDQFKGVIGENKSTDLQQAKTFGDLVKSVVGLSKLKGRPLIPEGRSLLPTAEAGDEEWDKAFSAAGEPKDAKDYAIKLEGVEDPEFAKVLEKNKFTEKLGALLKEAKVSVKGTVWKRISNALLNTTQAQWKASQESRKDIRAKIEEQWKQQPRNRNMTFEEAGQKGREAMNVIYGHSEQKPSVELQALLELFDKAGIADHPLVVSHYHRLSQRMMPATIVRGNTGPGVARRKSMLASIAPKTALEYEQMR